MYSKLQLAKAYLKYWLSASNGKGHGVHSPFVFDFIKNVLNDKGKYYCYQSVEAARKSLQHDETELEIQDFGAGSRVNSSQRRKVSSIARSALKPARYSQLLFRMVNHYQPATIIELGTSLGITTAYLASGNTKATVLTMEGAPAVAAVARDNFSQLGLTNIRLTEGNFDDTLPGVLHACRETGVDFAFIDGNHRYAPTIQYFTQLLAVTNEHSIIILDDIHWSEEMEKAWAKVQNHPQVTMTIDLFFIGIALFKTEFKVKQHFSVRF
jgi:predicted O-methyltransferase YrrM